MEQAIDPRWVMDYPEDAIALISQLRQQRDAAERDNDRLRNALAAASRVGKPVDLNAWIESYLRKTGMSATNFGREVMDDPNFVADLREGRSLRSKTRERVRRFLEQADQ